MMRALLLFGALSILVAIPFPTNADSEGAVCNVRNYGAVGDAKTLDTLAFRQAIHECAGGGTVQAPAPGRYLIGPLNLTSGQTLQVDLGATLLGSTNLSDQIVVDKFPSYQHSRSGYGCRYQALIGAYNQTNIKVTGGGTIDGQGSAWWKGRSSLHVERPRLLEFQYITTLSVTNLTLKNSPYWTVHPIYCKGVYIADIDIEAPADSPNTDGIDPDSCSDVLIERYRYFGGDDAVAVKSGWNWAGINFALPSENILVRHAVSAGRGGYTIGSEMSGGVRNVTFTDSVSTGQSGIRISSELGRGGYVKDITFCNLQFSWQAVQGKTFLFHINQAYTPDNRNTTLSYFDSITFENITAVGPSDLPIGDFTCLPASPCTHFRLTNITVRGSRESYSCNFVRGNATDCSPHPCINGSTDAAVTIGSLVAAHGAERA